MTVIRMAFKKYRGTTSTHSEVETVPWTSQDDLLREMRLVRKPGTQQHETSTVSLRTEEMQINV
jgi:hypothetical protein